MTNGEVYPSIDELMPEILLTRIPATLAKDIATRYETLGTKYLTEHKTDDGRRVNAMMFTSRVANCLEEVVDSVFCVLGWIFKETENGEEPPDAAYSCLIGLIEIYGLLKAEEEADLAKSGGLVNVGD